MTVKRIAIIILILISTVFKFNGFAQKHINGLLFSSSAEGINDRTSLILFDKSPLKLKDSFRVDFDMSIWDINQFGYIFRVINENKQEINFAFVNFYGNDKIYLDFHSPITQKSVQIPITVQDIDEKKWLPISIIFDLKKDRAEVKWKNRSYFCQPIGLKNPSYVKLTYGLYGLNLDVPQMAIRNIHIEKSNKKYYNISLNETSGNKIHDEDGRVRGVVTNPNWIANNFFYWKEKMKFDCDSMAKISYDEKRNRIIIVNNKSLTTYSMRYDKKELQNLDNFPSSLSGGDAVYDNKNDLLYVYSLDSKLSSEPTMAILNMQNPANIIYKYAQIGNKLQHHNAFFGEKNNELQIFGGYGNHTYSNKIYKYNVSIDKWELDNYTGNEIYPRYFSAAGYNKDSTKVMIMGGVGNESGKQEHGGQYLYDLFSLNLKTQQKTKLWEIKDNLPFGFVPCSNLIVDEEHQCIYTLCYPQHQVNSFLQLYKFNISDGKYEIVSDSIIINTEKIETSVYLYYNKLMQEFYTVIRENNNDGKAKIRIYSLLSPPVRFEQLVDNKRSILFWFLILLLVPFVALTAFYLLKRKKENIKIVEALPQEIYTDEEIPLVYNTPKEIDKKNAVFVFGDFTVYDKNGKDISYRFSSKLRSVFALILFYSLDTNGISTDTLTSELWPDKDSDSAKNTRGVTINRLRGILADISGITLIHQNSKWYFSFDPEFYCDYFEYKQCVKDIQEENADEAESMSLLHNILKRGTLFPSVQENWIDTHKQEFEGKIYKILWSFIQKLYDAKKYTRVVEFANLYLMNDPLNEDVIKISVNSLLKIGKKDQALLMYNKFASNYKKSMGEEPNLSLF